MSLFLKYLNEVKGSENDFKIRDELNIILGKDNVKVNTKGKWHIRSNIGSDPIIFLERYGFNVEIADVSLSQQYTTYRIEKNGISTYFVNTIRSNSSIKTKELTPEKFGVVGVDLSSSKLFKTVSEKIMDTNYSSNIKTFLLELLNKAKTKSDKISIDSFDVGVPEIRTIANDFGEILCALWSMYNIGFRRIHFPTVINEPLLDFYGVSGKIRYPISVKSGQGSATSLKNISKLVMSKMTDPTYSNNFTQDEKKLIDVIMAVSDLPIMEGFIEANKMLNTKGIKVLSKVTNIPLHILNTTTLDMYIRDKSSSELKKTLEPFYKTMGNYIDDKTWDRYDKGTLVKLIGVIIGPLGHYLVKEMNSKDNIKLLSSIANKVILLQINIDINSKSMTFKYKRFRDFTFKFSWQGGAPNPNRNRLGFKAIMKK
jgi:hypothetical protein